MNTIADITNLKTDDNLVLNTTATGINRGRLHNDESNGEEQKSQDSDEINSPSYSEHQKVKYLSFVNGKPHLTLMKLENTVLSQLGKE